MTRISANAFGGALRRIPAPRHAVELAREGVALNVIQRQLGHANLGKTSIYLQGIDTEEIIATVHARRAPMMSATAELRHRRTPSLTDRGAAAGGPAIAGGRDG